MSTPDFTMSTPDFAMFTPEYHKMASSDQDHEELEALKASLFDSVMKRNWDHVVETYRTTPLARRAQITKLKDTALHIAVSTVRGDIAMKLLEVIYDKMEDNILVAVVNTEGNTPLHLAAAQGDLEVCKKIAFTSNPQVLNVRNNKGETPLFLAANNGKEKTFFFLHSRFPQEQLLRRSDGSTVLHMAISREYFRMALKIIQTHPNIAGYLDENGLSPLHFLANKPNAFKSSTRLGLFDRILYYCSVVDSGIEHVETVEEEEVGKNKSGISIKHPENYETCKFFIGKLKYVLMSVKSLIEPRNDKKENNKANEEKQPVPNEEDSENENSSGTNYPENYNTCMIFIKQLQRVFSKFVKSLIGLRDQRKDDNKADEEKHSGKIAKEHKVFPPNYDSRVSFFKRTMMALLTILGIGIWRLNKIRKMKRRHLQAKLLMNELVRHSSMFYAAGSDRKGIVDFAAGSVPQNTEAIQLILSQEDIPVIPEKKTLHAGSPILIAAKAGIVEMVGKILEDLPVAIQDVDSNGKNVVLLAVENRQPHVYDLLVQLNKKKVFPKENVFGQVDNEGNTALHLTGKQFDQIERPSLIHGSALHLQLEIKWYQFVKKSMPVHFFALYNNEGKTPRDIFLATHKELINEASEWVSKISESCSVVAVLVATVAFATASTVPGGVKPEDGAPTLKDKPPFITFAMSSLFALCSSITALVFFLSIITSRHRDKDFAVIIPRKLLLACTFLFTSIVSMLVSFFGGYTFILKDELRDVTYPLYAALCFPLALYTVSLLSLYVDLLMSIFQKIPHKI